MIIYPKQSVPSSEKRKKEWGDSNALYWKQKANFNSSLYKELDVLFRIAEGDLITSDYKYILNPLNTDDEKFTYFPAALRNYPIIKPVINAYLGEQTLKPDTLQVVAVNADSINQLEEELNNQYEQAYQQDLINKLNEKGVQTNKESKPVEQPEQIKKRVTSTWREKRALAGQEALDYIKYDCRLEDKNQELLYYWIVAGTVYTRKRIEFNDIRYEPIDPRNLWISYSGESKYAEDGNAAVYRTKMSFNDCIDNFHDILETEDVERLEQRAKTFANTDPNFVYVQTEYDLHNGNTVQNHILNEGFVHVFHIEWKTVTQVGFLKYIDEYGYLQETEVDDTYVFDKTKGDIEINWDWLNEVYECYVIDEDIITKAIPTLVQRTKINNVSRCKLSYNGIRNIKRDGTVNSIAKDGMTYQALYNIYQYKRELSINKNRDKILAMAKGLVPNDLGGAGTDPIEAFTYYLDATSTLWYDETKPNAAAIVNSLKSIDLSLGTSIETITNILATIKSEYWDLAGMNRQRYGEALASDGKYVTQQALIRSSTITAEYFRKFDSFLEVEGNGFLDFSKVAWINGKKGQYITSDGRKMFFEIDPSLHLETEYNVFCVNNAKEALKRDTFKELAKLFAQDPSVKKSAVGVMITEDSSNRILQYLKEAEEDLLQRQEAAQESTLENNKYLADKESEDKSADRDILKYKIDKESDTQIRTAVIKATSSVLGFDQGENGNQDIQVIEELAHSKDIDLQNISLKREQLNLARQKNAQDAKHAAEKLNVEREKIKSTERIAKARPKPKSGK